MSFGQVHHLDANVGMSPQHLSEIESGKRDPRLSSIERMAEVSFTIETFDDPETGQPTQYGCFSRNWQACKQALAPRVRHQTL